MSNVIYYIMIEWYGKEELSSSACTSCFAVTHFDTKSHKINSSLVFYGDSYQNQKEYF